MMPAEVCMGHPDCGLCQARRAAQDPRGWIPAAGPEMQQLLLADPEAEAGS